jgi:hypothetical protein
VADLGFKFVVRESEKQISNDRSWLRITCRDGRLDQIRPFGFPDSFRPI